MKGSRAQEVSQTMLNMEAIKSVYARQAERHEIGRRRLGRALTLGEKILFNHLAEPETQEFERRKSFLDLHPDRVAMQDATAQMALLQFMVAGREEVALPSTVHCDHLIRAYEGANSDLATANHENNEVYSFLQSVSARYGLGFWKPGAGIIHQVVLENYAFPGGLMIGTDSHTPNAGGLGMVAVGVGGADAVDAMVGLPWEVLNPGYIGVKLTGSSQRLDQPAKDVILKRAARSSPSRAAPTASSSTSAPAARASPPPARGPSATWAPSTARRPRCSRSTRRWPATCAPPSRAELADLAEQHAAELRADPEVDADPERYYDRVVEIDLSDPGAPCRRPAHPRPRPPHLGPGRGVREGGLAPQDHLRAHRLVHELLVRGHLAARRTSPGRPRSRASRRRCRFMVTPGSDQILETIQRDGLRWTTSSHRRDGAGQRLRPLHRPVAPRRHREGRASTAIVTSFNRNFRGRNDANPDAVVHRLARAGHGASP